MSLSLHTIAPNPGAHEHSFRIGRGHGSGRGKTAGKGTKGQRARSGGKKGLLLKGMRQMLLSFPKVRGFQSFRSKMVAIPVQRLDVFPDGTTVDLKTLQEAGMVHRDEQAVKIVGGTALTHKLTVVGLSVTGSAKELIEKAGGKVSAEVARA
jgi:large subunit ribosomal protein L15